jgi:hypothetical protein
MSHDGCTQKGKNLFLSPKKNEMSLLANGNQSTSGSKNRQKLPPADAPKEGELEMKTYDKGKRRNIVPDARSGTRHIPLQNMWLRKIRKQLV